MSTPYLEHRQQILVSGSMRSGTTLLSSVLNAHPEISLIIDKINWFWNRVFPYYNLNYYSELKRALFEQEYFIRIGLDALGMNYNKFVQDLLYSVNTKQINWISVYKNIHYLVTQNTNTIIGDKSTHSSNIYLKFAEESTGKIIHLVRNPYDVFYSQMKKVSRKRSDINVVMRKAAMFRKYKNELVVKLLSRDYKHKYHKGLMMSKGIFVLDPISIIDYWKQSNMLALEINKRTPEKICIIKYEDLLIDYNNTIKRIMDLLELEYNREYFQFDKLVDEKGIKFNPNSSFPKKLTTIDASRIGNGLENISNIERKYIKEAAGELIKIYNYSD